MNIERLTELYMEEDCPYLDETTELLGITGIGTMSIFSREEGISACTEELGEFLESKGLKVIYLPSDSSFKKGDTILSAEGNLRTLFRSWRVSQTLLALLCAIATRTRRIVEKARKVNPDVTIATTRKTHPGMRCLELKAIKVGGATYHRNSLSDSILITQNHLGIVGKLPNLKTLRKIEIEPRNDEEAIKLAPKADLLLLDHFTLDELKKLAPKLRKINPRLEIATAGDISENNITEYAPFVDVVVTSAPYYPKPLNLTTKIEKP